MQVQILFLGIYHVIEVCSINMHASACIALLCQGKEKSLSLLRVSSVSLKFLATTANFLLHCVSLKHTVDECFPNFHIPFTNRLTEKVAPGPGRLKLSVCKQQ